MKVSFIQDHWREQDQAQNSQLHGRVGAMGMEHASISCETVAFEHTKR